MHCTTIRPHLAVSAFVFDLAELQVIKVLQLPSAGTPLAGVPEAHGVVHITTARDGVSVYGVAGRYVIKLDTATLRVVVLDVSPVADLYQIVESPVEDGVFYMGAQSHVLKYHVDAVPHFR